MRNLSTWLEVIGNGDINKGYYLMEELAKRLKHAREKHPIFPSDRGNYSQVLLEEVYEHLREVERFSYERAKDEALDIMTVLVRYRNCE